MDMQPSSADFLLELRGEVRGVQVDPVSHALQDVISGRHSPAGGDKVYLQRHALGRPERYVFPGLIGALLIPWPLPLPLPDDSAAPSFWFQ